MPVDSRRVHFVGFRPYESTGCCRLPRCMCIYGTVRAFGGLFESMSCGCLLVSSDTEPVREVVRHSENGFLCDFWDHDMLADMTTELLARSDAMGQ
ncbi:MAG: glycosyltransferase [Bilophila wadsworthia]